ncbi:membrane-associated guanylate kinase, WW and PDZ domain-containing protein 3a isoform X2 [Leuresthes tenuis]|uniref:membrane-associated guanylate kinase, WW and PDZ domain-containing protein 3a isoform X2 n=1 Tax=Leuresthes tenuis TaxID=355514 RepID=UPI003B50E4EB
MSKTLKKKKHWSAKVQECTVSWGGSGELVTVVEVRGGAELGEFPYLGHIVTEATVCHAGRFPSSGDVLLEVNGTPVSGLTNRDTLAVVRHFREPIRLKTVKPGKVLNTDLRHYLSLQFQKGSVDHKLQQVIRDNLYLRTIPCTTRQPRDGEVPGVDYNFISVGEFRELEESGLLLESGTYDGNYYGTPKPPAEPSPVQPDLVDQVLFDEEFDTEVQRKRTTSVSKMDRKDSAAPEEEEEEERPPMVNGVGEHKDKADWRRTVPSYNQSAGTMDMRVWNPQDESQDPLPKNWEMAYTETGMVYFIDHNNKTTTWLDPRLAKKAKPPEKCEEGELPYGWEKIEDPQFGTYYVDHINQKTQFENPVMEAKRKLSVDTPIAAQPQAAAPSEEPERGVRGFTRDPSQLQGSILQTALRKSPQGFGFTIIGGDRPDEFLQVKNVLPDGPAAHDNKIASGQTSPVKSLKPCTAPMSHAVSQPGLHQAPHSVPQQLPPPSSQGTSQQQQRKEMINSTETLSQPDVAPNTLPFTPSTMRSSSPKPDASELYLKSKAMLDSKPPNTKDLDVFIKRNQESGFGFRVLGGEGPDQPVYIGAIVPLGAAEKDGRLRAGDELLCIDGVPVKGKSHKQVLELMTNAARNGQVMLTVRRKLAHTDAGGEEGNSQQPQQVASALVNSSPKMPRVEAPNATQPAPSSRPERFDVTLHRKDNEGFGFVILTSKNKPPPGVIPHKIGRIIEGSPTDRTGRMKVGDRISAVNGRSIMELSHNDIVQLIKDAGNSVTLTVVPEDDSAPPSGANSAKQSPSAQHRAVGQQPPSYPDRNDDSEGKNSVSPSEMGTLIALDPKQGCFVVELERSQRGFGFSLRGGKEYNMGLYILRLAEDGPALKDGRIHVGDQIVEINGEATQGITHTRAIELIQAGGSKVHLLLRPGQGLVPDHSSKDKVTIPATSFPRLSASDDQSPLASPSSVSLSTSERSPSSTKTFAPDELSGGDRRMAGSPGARQDHGRQAHRSRGQQPAHLNHKRTTSPNAHSRKTGRSDPKSGSPKRVTEGWTDHAERSQSLRKTERGHGGSLEDVSKERPAQGPRDHHSSSPRKGSKREHDPALTSKNLEEPHSPRRPAGQQPSVSTGEMKDWRYKGEDVTYWQEGATEGGDKSWGTGERHRKGKRAEKEAAPQKSHSERAGSDADTGTLGQRSKYQAPPEEVNRKDPRDSSSSIQDPNCNGTTTSKKAPITPGPWKVPSSAKVQSHVDTAYADV